MPNPGCPRAGVIKRRLDRYRRSNLFGFGYRLLGRAIPSGRVVVLRTEPRQDESRPCGLPSLSWIRRTVRHLPGHVCRQSAHGSIRRLVRGPVDHPIPAAFLRARSPVPGATSATSSVSANGAHRPSTPQPSLPSFAAISDTFPVVRFTSTRILSLLGVDAMAQASHRPPFVNTA